MKKITSVLLSVMMLLSVTVLTYAAEVDESPTVADMEDQLNSTLPEDSPFEFEFVGEKSADPAASARSTRSAETEEKTLFGFQLVLRYHYDGYYIDGNGVNVRTRPRMSATIIGKLYDGDIVWYDPFEDWTYADGYDWIHVFTDSMSNMGEDEGYMVTDYLGDAW